MLAVWFSPSTSYFDDMNERTKLKQGAETSERCNYVCLLFLKKCTNENGLFHQQVTRYMQQFVSLYTLPLWS